VSRSCVSGGKLTFVRRRPFAKTGSSKAVLLMLLALQLVVGLQLQAAQAATMPMSHTAMRMAMAAPMPIAVVTAGAVPQPDCPTHSAHGASRSTAHNVRTSANLSGAHEHTLEHGPVGKHAPMGIGTHDEGTHDCCQASACQCHCVYTPGSIALPALANIATSVAIPSLASARIVAPRIDEFLRPPIA
jgi:hypothetical protein